MRSFRIIEFLGVKGFVGRGRRWVERCLDYRIQGNKIN